MSKEPKVKKEKKQCAFAKAIDGYFQFSKRGTNIKTEIFAGILMFVEVVVFMMVNAELLASSTDISGYSHIYFATVLVAAITSVLIGLLCNVPFVQSTSLGMTVLIISIIGKNAGLTYANVMAMALIGNLVYFVVMVVPPARKFVFEAVPVQVRKALPAALGAFLLVYVLVQLNVLTVNTMNFAGDLEDMAAAGEYIPMFTLNYVSLNLDMSGANWYTFMPVITGIIAFAALMILKSFKVRHATIISFGGALLIYLVMWLLRRNFNDYYLFAFFSPSYGGMYFYDSLGRITKLFNSNLMMSAFGSGFDFSGYTEALAAAQGVDAAGVNAGGNIFVIFLTGVVSFLVLGVSETGAVVAAHAYESGSADENGRALHTQNEFLKAAAPYANVYSVNALSSVLGCMLGAGPVVARPESLVGTSEGGRTGLSAIVAGLLFIVAVFFIVFSGLLINGIVVYGLLFYVGLTLLTAFKNCDFSGVQTALPFISTVACAALTMNLGTAAAVGIVTDTLMRVLTRRIKTVGLGTWILTAVMLAVLVLGFVF